MKAPRCGKRYGKRRQLKCRRLAGHSGPHALRLRLTETHIKGRNP